MGNAVSRINEQTFLVLLELMDAEGGGSRDLANIFRLIGKENTLLLMNYYKGVKVQFPTEDLVDRKLKGLLGYVLYKVEGRPWDEVLDIVHEGNVTPKKNMSLRDSIREVGKRCRLYNYDLTGIKVDHVSNLEDDIEYVKGELKDE